jgi:mannose-6-phosphate isomerase-like protein (cupin superfamily)
MAKSSSIQSLLFILFFISLINGYSQSAEDIRKISIEELLTKQRQDKKISIEFLSEATLTATLYHLEASDGVLTKSSEFDCVYYIVGGSADLKVDNKISAVEKDSIFYVPANRIFSLFNIRDKLDILAILSKCPAAQQDTGLLLTSLNQLESNRNPNDNAWNPLIKKKTLTLGLYMLPKRLGGDSVLIHLFDELNFITKGTGKFSVGQKLMDVKPGDLVYVRKGNGHYFHNLDTDLDIIIFFEKKSVQATASSGK